MIGKECNVPACRATDTREYIPGPRCPAHTPAALAGRPEPPQTDASWIAKSRQTLPSAQGGTDINKERPGGYTSRQKAQRIAATRDALRSQGTEAQPNA